jgi:hypothetical protein
MKYFLILLLFVSSAHAETCSPHRDKYGHISRSKKVLSDFRKTAPCPATGKTGKRCAGYVIDHVKPLCACGPDAVENLQWQTVAESKVKDRWERKLCKGQSD